MTINKKLLVLGVALLGNMLLIDVFGQTATNTISLGMPEVLLLGSNTGTINLTLTPTTAGNAVLSSISNSDARILMSSVVSGTETRSMSARITTGAVPAGTLLKVVALTPNTNFVGTAGTASAEITLNGTTDQNVITGIGTCYSGTSSDDGYPLKYTYALPENAADYGLIRASGGTNITVTLTLSDGI